MADDQITQMVNDPDFAKLSASEQRKALAAHDPLFNKVSDDEIGKFVAAHHAAKNPAPAGLPPVTKFSGTDIPVSPSRIPSYLTGHKNEDFTQEQAQNALRTTAPIAGGFLGGTPGALLGAAAGEGAAQIMNPSENPPEEMLKAMALQGVFEGAGKGVSLLAGKTADAMAPALARVLRLSPKAFQFGREPAQEVLERGLAKGTLPEIKGSISEASKQVTSELNDALESTKGRINVENAALDVANNLGGNAGSRFLKVIDDAAAKLGFRSNQLSSLSAADTNLLKQEVARQSKFVEGDLRPSISTGGKVFGGKLKDEMVKLNPDVADLLESSSNLTEASKAADFAVRSEKAGQGKGLLGGVQVNKPSTYPRAITDRPGAPQTLFQIANGLKDHTSISNALRIAFIMAFGNHGDEQ